MLVVLLLALSGLSGPVVEASRIKMVTRHDTNIDEMDTAETELMVDEMVFSTRPPTTAEKQAFLDTHNKYRCMHGVPAVEWSDDVADDANSYISPMTVMRHSDSYNVAPPAGPAGESLAMSSHSMTAEHAVKMWYDEVEDCIGGAESFTDGCPEGQGGAAVGHFTALIWKGVKSIGCAFSNSNQPTLIICRYKAGDKLSLETPNMNKPSNYPNHVFKRTQTESQCGPSSPTPASPTPASPTPASPTPSSSGGGCPKTGNYLQTCGKCLYSAQCAVGSFCCPYMKKCVPTSQTPCSTPTARCSPVCRESASGYPQSCTSCTGSDNFPDNWVTCDNSGSGGNDDNDVVVATTTTTTTPESGTTERTGCITASGPGMCNLAWGTDCASSTKVTFACLISASGRYSQYAGRTFNFGMTAYPGHSRTFTDCETCNPIKSVESR